MKKEEDQVRSLPPVAPDRAPPSARQVSTLWRWECATTVRPILGMKFCGSESSGSRFYGASPGTRGGAGYRSRIGNDRVAWSGPWPERDDEHRGSVSGQLP